MNPLKMPENQQLSFGEKLKLIRISLKMSQKEFGEVLGLKQYMVSDHEKGSHETRESTKSHISSLILKSFPVNPVWWETGEGDMFLTEQSQQTSGTSQAQSNARIRPIITENEYTELPFVSIPARATFAEIGDGINVDMHETFMVYRKPGEDFSDQIVIEIDGDSMEPYYVSGSKVRAKRVPADRWPYLTSGVYAVAAGGSFLIKRIKNNDFHTGTIVLHSDNEATGGSLTIKIQDIRSIWKVLRIVDSPAR